MSKIPKNEEEFIEKYYDVKFTWYQKMCCGILRFITKVKVAFHRPYMIKAILTGRCPQCGKWFSFPTIQSQRTMYQDWYSNYFCGCKECQLENDGYWDDRWDEYYSGRF